MTSSVKCCVLGGAGGIGLPLSLLLKQSQVLTELALFDVVPVVKGVAVDISHVNTPSVVTGYTKDDDGLAKALKNADIVVIPAGVPRKVRIGSGADFHREGILIDTLPMYSLE